MADCKVAINFYDAGVCTCLDLTDLPVSRSRNRVPLRSLKVGSHPDLTAYASLVDRLLWGILLNNNSSTTFSPQ